MVKGYSSQKAGSKVLGSRPVQGIVATEDGFCPLLLHKEDENFANDVPIKRSAGEGTEQRKAPAHQQQDSSQFPNASEGEGKDARENNIDVRRMASMMHPPRGS